MYEIRPESIKTFIEDTSIKLPRFQRKQTWDGKKNFELCISIFKQFPMGVCILNVELDQGRSTKWLLDGRQRRNALTRMWEDPENIYEWAKKWIGFKTSAQPHEVEEQFWAKVNDYLEEEELDATTEPSDEPVEPENGPEGSDDSSESDDALTAVETLDTTKNNLDFLLEILLLIHNKTSKHSGFTRPFDFSKIITNLPYEATAANGKAILSSKRLKTFVYQYKSWSADEGIESEEVASLKRFLKTRFDLNQTDAIKVNTLVDQNWTKIVDRFRLLDKIQDLIVQSKIGLIEVKEISATDAQKIFNIINSKGTKLNAVEVLSAKPSWNRRIANPTTAQVDAKDALYKRIDIKYEGLVQWDLGATLLARLSDFETFIKLPKDSTTGLDKQLTLGFKLLSGIFEKGVRKEDVDKLGRNIGISWERDYEKTVEGLTLMTKMILATEYFKYLKSWRTSITDLLSDATALNFILVMYEDWKRKDRPIASDTKAKQFQKNAFILIDQLIYEYVIRQWRGSSDSKIAGNLNTFPNQPEVFEPITSAAWTSLLSEIFETNSIANVKITQKIITPILYHFYSISKIQGPDSNLSIEVDHIIPQSLFSSSTIPEKDYVQHNLFNLALLPKNENCSKGSQRLRSIEEQWLKDQIRKYEFIEPRDFEKFSDLRNLNELKQLRAPIFLNAFGPLRDTLLAN
jgi:hypothetical protein